RGTANSQGQSEEESQNEFRMPELLDTLLDLFPRIALGIDTSSGPRLGHLCDRVGAECCRRQHAYKGNHGDGRDCAQRPSKMAIKAKKMSPHSLPVPYQNQFPSRPGCRVGVSLPSLSSYGFSPRTLTGLKGINPGGSEVLPCGEVPIVVWGLGKLAVVLCLAVRD